MTPPEVRPQAAPEPEPATTPLATGAVSRERPVARQRAPAVRYLGFEVTREGREYSLQVTSGEAPRTFVVLVSHEAFASRKTRFQDAPDLCFRRLGRELVADPDLMPGERLELTVEELLDYRAGREEKAAPRKPRPTRD